MKDQLFNRKIIFSLLAVVMCLGFTAMSYGAAVVSVDPATIESPAAGEQLMVNINITGGAGVGAYQVTVNFDPTALSYVAAANADYLQGDPAAGTLFPVIKPADASVTVGATVIGVPPSDGDGALATVTFEVIEAKASTISLTGVVLSDVAASELEVTTADGMVTAPAVEEPVVEEPAVEEPAVEEPAVEEPTVEEPTVEEPTVEEPTVEEPTVEEPTVEEPTVEEPTVEEPTVEEPTVEEPTVEEPTVEEPTVEEPVKMPVSQMFEIKLTNLTTGEAGSGGQVFSHPIFVTHAAGINLAAVGQPASPALVLLAENGDASGLAALATVSGAMSLVADNMVPPGGSITVTVTADAVNSSLFVGSMLVSTNDAFVAATDVPLFDEAGMPISASIDLMSYDAGSEDNTEMASDIPGPLGLDAAADPAGSNASVPTEGGVIAAHGGIQGVGDVSEAFAWTEPTAMLMITPVDAPAAPVVEAPVVEAPVVEAPVVEAPVVETPVVETPVVETPVVEAPMVTEGPGFDVTLTPGLNMISIPLMPEEPYTAKSLAEMLGATVIIQLDAATQNFVGYTVADTGDGFGIDGGRGYIVNTPTGGMVKFTGSAWDNQPVVETPVIETPVVETPVVEAPVVEAPVVEAPVVEAPVVEAPVVEAPVVEAPAAEEAPAAPALSTYKSAWAFIVTSDIRGMNTGTSYTVVAENLRTGIIATETITSNVNRSSAVWADLNRKSVVEAGDKFKIALYDERGTIVSGPFQRTVATADIRNAFLSLQLTVGDVQPKDTILAQNYPNPFNPETWIPYQLSKATEVTIDIHNVAGHLVRTLDLGLKSTGSYMTPATAAYWDGKNSIGERVASGIYFYTFQTPDFAATRRMVILK